MDDSSLTAWLAIVRAIHFAACMLIFGVWMFDRFVIRDKVPQWRRLAMAILLIATPLALISGAAWLILVTANMSDLTFAGAIRNPDALKLVWLHTQFGHAWQIHFAFWMAGGLIAGIWAAFGYGRWIGLICGAGLVGGLAWSGHGSTGPAPSCHLSMDVLHLLASSVWPAGLVPLGCILPPMIRSKQWTAAAEIIRRFSASSLVAVGLLTLTGLFDSWCLLGSFGALYSTPYGRMLLLKLALFAGMIALGAVNLLALKRRLPEGAVPIRMLWRNVLIEIALGTFLIAAVGLLGLLEPARTGIVTATVSSSP